MERPEPRDDARSPGEIVAGNPLDDPVIPYRPLPATPQSEEIISEDDRGN